MGTDQPLSIAEKATVTTKETFRARTFKPRTSNDRTWGPFALPATIEALQFEAGMEPSFSFQRNMEPSFTLDAGLDPTYLTFDGEDPTL